MDNYIRRDDKGGIDFRGTMKEIGATLLGVRDEQKRAQAVGAETRKKYIDKYDRLEDTVRHGIMHGLFLDKEGKTGFREKLSSNLMNLQKNEDDTSIKGKVKNFVADVAGESSDQESEIDLNNNKFSAALRKKMIAEGDTSEESFIDAVVNIARGLRKGEESPEIDGLKLQLSLGKLNYPKYERFKNNILNGPTPWADNFNFDDTKYPVGAVGSSTKPLQRPKVLKLSKGGASEKKLTMDEGGLSKQTEKAFSSNPLEGKETVKRLKNVGQFATEMLPGVGEVVTAKEIKKDYDKSNWVGVGLGAVALGVGLIPGVGDVASRGIKKLNEKIRSSLSKGKEINDTFTGEVNLVHGFYGDAPTKKFEKDFQGARYEETGGAYGGGVYLEDPENLYFNTPVLDKRMYLPRTVQVSTKFNKAFVLKPSTVKKLEKITGVDLKSTAFISSGNAAVEEAGQAVTKKLKDLGYDGLIIKDFSEQDVGKLYNNPKYKKALANYEANKNSDIAYKNFIKEADKIDEAQYKFDAKQGLNSYLTQPQIISLNPEKLNVVDELPRKFVSSETNPKYLESIKQIPKNPKFSKGGTTMKKQMEMFEEGGLRDDGTTKDPVSGNDVPSGSMAEEVRDDIPAQLSEGEYVVPADVVRFYGVKFFEDLRMEAKIGLANMEKNGRIGGEPVAVTMIASTAEEELSKEEEKALEELMGAAKGGLTGYAPGGSVTNTGQQLNQSSFNPANYAVVGGVPKGGTYPNQSSPTILIPYVHATDSTKPIIQVPTINGTVQQGFVVPQGYIPQSEYKPPAPKVSKGGDSKSGGTGTANKPDNDPWGTTEEYDFNNWGEEDFLKEAETQLGKSSGEALGQGLATAIAGPVGYIAAGAYNNVDGIARVRAMAMVAEAKGLDDVAAKLRTEANEAVENSGWLTKFSEKMGWIDGQNKFDAIMKNNPITSTTVKPVSGVVSKPISSTTQKPLVRKDSTSSIIKEAENKYGKDSPIVKNIEAEATKAEEKIRDIETGKNTTGRVGFKEGGLLTKPKRKPKTVKPRGKGLASK